jgi:citrate lyase subunit beta / citryl-CoA lyase
MVPRSLLLVTPTSDGALASAAASGADGLVVDLTGAGAQALRRAVAFLSGTRDGAVYVRVGPLADAATGAALDALIPTQPTGVALAGAAGGADVARLSALLRPREAMAGIDDGAARIIAMATDTPAGLLALGTYAGASSRLVALAWDDAPLARALGAADTTDVAHAARTGTLVAAAAAGVAALDRPFRGSDRNALAAEAEAASRAGFAGKLALAAAQVAVINAAFRRTADSNS